MTLVTFRLYGGRDLADLQGRAIKVLAEFTGLEEERFNPRSRLCVPWSMEAEPEAKTMGSDAIPSWRANVTAKL